jgi:hypothetical protein
MEKQTAALVSQRLLRLSGEADASVTTVMTHDAAPTARAYRALVGRLMGYAYTNVLAQVWRHFPELEPEGMRKAATNPSTSLSSESKAALGALVERARSELAFLRGLPASESFPESAIAELEQVVSEIEAFMFNPAAGGAPSGSRRVGV